MMISRIALLLRESTMRNDTLNGLLRKLNGLAQIIVPACALICAMPEISQAQTKLIIARHGTAAYNPAAPEQDRNPPDPPLAPQGRSEALRLAALAKAEGIDVIVHSPLLRASETAQIVGNELKLTPVVVPDLAELNLGDLLGKDWSKSPYREQLAEVLGDPDRKRPGGESFNQLSDRVIKALDRLLAQHKNSKILLIAHGITNRALLGNLRGQSAAEAFAQPSQANNEAYVVNFSAKGKPGIVLERY